MKNKYNMVYYIIYFKYIFVFSCFLHISNKTSDDVKKSNIKYLVMKRVQDYA
jgi:hypothetical protein